MESEDDEWYTAFAMSEMQNKTFFVIIEKGISAMLINRKDVSLGSFYKVKYAFNSSARANNRAQHLIIQYRSIAPLAEANVDVDDVGRQHVIITTKARYAGMVNSGGSYVAKLYNDIFGNFIDLKNIVKERNKMVTFDFKCMASPVDAYRSVFVPINILAYEDLPVELSEVAGFVCSDSSGSTYLWSKELDTNAYIDERNWSPSRDMRAYWVTARVDIMKNCVVGQVEQITDIFRGRLYEGISEVLVTFRYCGFSDEKRCRIYQHNDFPCIYDFRHHVQHDSDDFFYTGWLHHQRTERDSGFWVVSTRQPMIRGIDSDEMERMQRPDSRSSSRQSFQPAGPVNGDPGWQSNNSNERDYFDQRPEPENRPNRVRPRSRTSSRVLTTSEEDSENEDIIRREVVDDVRPGHRRKAGSSRKNAADAPSRASDSRSEEESENESEQYHQRRYLSRASVNGNSLPSRNESPDQHSTISSTRGRLRETPNAAMQEKKLKLMVKKYAATIKYLTNGKLVAEGIQFYDHKEYESLKELETQVASFTPWLQKLSHSVGATEKRNRVLSRRLQKISLDVKSWLDDELVEITMRQYDPSEFDELLKCISSENQDRSLSLEQEQDALKLCLTKCALLIEYFTENSNVSAAMVKYNKTEYEEFIKRVKEIYDNL